MIKIISSNIRFDNPADGKNSWSFRKQFMADTFLSLTPNFICSQEGRVEQLKELESLLTGFKIEDNHRDWIKQRMYPCIYTRDSNCIDSDDFWLSETPEVPGSLSFSSAFPRLCNWIKVRDGENLYFIFNMHLDHTTDDVRFAQAQVAIREISRINLENLPMIIVGDFNTGPDSEIYDLFINKLNLKDPWVDLGLEEESSYHIFRGYLYEGKRIDWILISDHFNCKKIEYLKHQKEKIYLSDHFPVYAEIKLIKGYKV